MPTAHDSVQLSVHWGESDKPAAEVQLSSTVKSGPAHTQQLSTIHTWGSHVILTDLELISRSASRLPHSALLWLLTGSSTVRMPC